MPDSRMQWKVPYKLLPGSCHCQIARLRHARIHAPGFDPVYNNRSCVAHRLAFAKPPEQLEHAWYQE